MGLRLVLVCLTVSVGIATSGASGSEGANREHKLAIHAKSHPTSCTTGYPTFGNCGQITFTYGGCGDVDVMPVFFDLVEYRLNEFGLEWPAQWGSMSWVRCRGDVAVGTIARSGEGTAIAWSTCQRTWSIAPGFGWLAPTSPGKVCPIRNRATDDWGTVDCTPEPGPYYDYPANVYCAGICGADGEDPCIQPGASGSSWGKIKSMFK